MKKTLLLMALLVCLVSSPAFASYIVDTGTPTGPSWLLMPGGTAFGARFSIGQSTTLTGIEAYMAPYNNYSGTVSVQLYSESGGLPGAAYLSYTPGFYLDETASPSWYGVNGLNETLAPGNYWVAFFISSIFSNHVALYAPAPNPLATEAYRNTSGNWFINNDLNLGIRITGEAPSAVPLPPAVLLLGSGLAGLMLKRRKQD